MSRRFVVGVVLVLLLGRVARCERDAEESPNRDTVRMRKAEETNQ